MLLLELSSEDFNVDHAVLETLLIVKDTNMWAKVGLNSYF